MSWSGLAKFFLGVTLAIALLMAGGVATALYFMYKVTTPPPRPTFANDKSITPPQSATSTSVNAASTPKPQQKALEPGTYLARVNWSEGLSLRSEPSMNGERIGGIEYNQQIIVLEESKDKNWQHVRLDGGEQEGWIKAGNIERVEAQ